VVPEDVSSPEDEERLLSDLTADLAEGITLELDGRYQAMFSYKMKNYALLDERRRPHHHRLGPPIPRTGVVSARVDGGDVSPSSSKASRRRFRRSPGDMPRRSNGTPSMSESS
jgi:hypothetical protein